MSGYAINYLTPTAALGGEVTKGVLLSAYHRGPDAASGVLIGKLCFALAHLTFVTLGALLVLWRLPMPESLWITMLVCGGVVGSGMLAFFLLQKYGKLGAIVRWLAARRPDNRTLNTFTRNLTAVDAALMRFYHERPLDLTLAVAWHLAGYSVGIVQTFLFFHLIGYHASFSVAAGTWFLGMWFDLLTFAVPLNLGTLEGTRVVVLRAFGYSALTGLTYGFAFRLAQIFWACFGLLNYALLSRGNTATLARHLPGFSRVCVRDSMPRDSSWTRTPSTSGLDEQASDPAPSESVKLSISAAAQVLPSSSALESSTFR
jgi:hypothetical protein